MSGMRTLLAFVAMGGALLGVLMFTALPSLVTAIILPTVGTIVLVGVARMEDGDYRQFARVVFWRLQLWCGMSAAGVVVLSVARLHLLDVPSYTEPWLRAVRLLILGLLCDYTWVGQRHLVSSGRYRGLPRATLALATAMIDIVVDLGFVVGILVQIQLRPIAWPRRDGHAHDT
jgi:hypothetical protein